MYFTSLIGGFGAAAAVRTGRLCIPQRLPVAAAISSWWPLEACLLAQDHDGSRAATLLLVTPRGRCREGTGEEAACHRLSWRANGQEVIKVQLHATWRL